MTKFALPTVSVPFLRFVWLFVLAGLGCFSPLARGIGDPGEGYNVVYDPNTLQSITAELPVNWSYTVKITAPTLAAPTTVTLGAQVVAAPSGISTATAASYLTFSQSVLNFSSSGQSISVVVTFTAPLGAPTGDYNYFLSCSGWPSGTIDNGTYINMHAIPPGQLLTPTVTINTPEEGAVYLYPTGATSLPIDIDISGTAPQNAPVLTLTGTIQGVDSSGAVILPSTPLGLTLTGLGSPNAAGKMSFPVTGPGFYTITTVDSNVIGSATDTVNFEVRAVAPPTVVITTPPDPTYTYYYGSTPLHIPYVFEGRSQSQGITTLTAKLNGVSVTFTPDNLGEVVATGTGAFDLSIGGHYTLVVTATDDIGTATTSTEFDVVVIKPTPTIVIDDPANGTVFTLPTGATKMDVPFTFTVTTSPNFTISSISASLGGTSLSVPVQTGLGTDLATGSGTMAQLPVGTYTLTAYGVSAGIQVQTSTTFTIKSAVIATPPTVVINTPPVNSVYYIVPSGGCGGGYTPLSIPLTFTGTSTGTNAVITKLTATLNNSALTVTSTNLNTKIANGAATMVVSTTGTYTIKVTATDIYGTATATRTFTVVKASKQCVTGRVFFDCNFDGVKGSDDYGLSNVCVKLIGAAGQTIASTSTDCSGAYGFSVYPGTYIVEAGSVKGMALTTLNDITITVTNAAVTVSNIGYGLHFGSIGSQCANGYTIGYWKTNLDKAISCKPSGCQVSNSAMKSYTSSMGKLGLNPFDCISMSTASCTLGSTSSAPCDLLAKQLVACEYNYLNGAYIGGDARLTYAFVHFGEYVLKNKASYSSSYLLWVKGWCEAYNSSHGGKVAGPSY